MPKCEKHNIDMDCLAGRSAHISNGYCDVCDKEEKIINNVCKTLGMTIEELNDLLINQQKT